MEVRPGRPEDTDTLVEFQAMLAMETEGIRLDRETVAAGVRAVFADSRKGQYWVAAAEGQVVGSLLVTGEWSDWRNGTILWIQSLYVRQTHRRCGVFRMLFEHLRGVVEEDDGLLGLRLYVAVDNTVAQSAYKAVGMGGERYRMHEWMKHPE